MTGCQQRRQENFWKTQGNSGHAGTGRQEVSLWWVTSCGSAVRGRSRLQGSGRGGVQRFSNSRVDRLAPQTLRKLKQRTRASVAPFGRCTLESCECLCTDRVFRAETVAWFQYPVLSCMLRVALHLQHWYRPTSFQVARGLHRNTQKCFLHDANMFARQGMGRDPQTLALKASQGCLDERSLSLLSKELLRVKHTSSGNSLTLGETRCGKRQK